MAGTNDTKTLTVDEALLKAQASTREAALADARVAQDLAAQAVCTAVEEEKQHHAKSVKARAALRTADLLLDSLLRASVTAPPAGAAASEDQGGEDDAQS
jgi:hypothetical protein